MSAAKQAAFTLRAPTVADHASIGRIAEASEMFPADAVTDMMADHVTQPGKVDLWLVAELKSEDAHQSTSGANSSQESTHPRVTAFVYAKSEMLADGTWNMLALGCDPSVRRQGQARALVVAAEAELKARGARILIVDTSSGSSFDAARAFYVAAGYTEEGRIRDFWADGDDKIIFWKRLK